MKRSPMRIGLIADTHGLFDSSIGRRFAGVDRIIHAGDIGDPTVIDRLKEIAPVTAVSGNVDGYETSGFPLEAVMDLEGCRIAVRHVLFEGGKLTKEGKAFIERVHPDVCIFGHSHQPTIEHLGNILFVNPGSAGPRRFRLPRSLALLSLHEGPVQAQLLSLSAPRRGLKR